MCKWTQNLALFWEPDILRVGTRYYFDFWKWFIFTIKNRPILTKLRGVRLFDVLSSNVKEFFSFDNGNIVKLNFHLVQWGCIANFEKMIFVSNDRFGNLVQININPRNRFQSLTNSFRTKNRHFSFFLIFSIKNISKNGKFWGHFLWPWLIRF